MSADPPIRIRRLEERDDRSGFRSGNVDLDRFFQRFAGQNQFRHHIGTTYVAVTGEELIVGFATVTASEIVPESLGRSAKKRMPNYPLPVLRLARMAVDDRAKGRGVGSLLLHAVLLLAKDMSTTIGCVGLVVDAKPEAVAFDEKLGFLPLEARAGSLGDRPEPTPMFLEVGAMVTTAPKRRKS